MATVIKPVPQRLTCDDIAKSAEFLRLPKRMRTFALAYIQHYIDRGEWDAVSAARGAFTYANLNVLRVAAHRVSHHPKMQDVLNLFLHNVKTPLELDLEELQRHLNACEPGSVAAQRLLAMKHALKRGMKAESEAETPAQAPAPEVPIVRESVQSAIPMFPPAEPKYRVGTIEIDPDDGKPYILLAVSADGNEVTEARPLTKNDDGTFFDAVSQGTYPTADHVPPGATPLVDKGGVVRGYRTAENQYVQLADIEVK